MKLKLFIILCATCVFTGCNTLKLENTVDKPINNPSPRYDDKGFMSRNLYVDDFQVIIFPYYFSY